MIYIYRPDNTLWQPFWTVLTGTAVIAFGKIIETLCVNPIISYKKVIGEISYQLIFYARECTSPSLKQEMYQEATEKFRKSASRLQTYFNPISWMHLWSIPSEKEVDTATKALMGLSNGIPPHTSEDGIQNKKKVTIIRKMLQIHDHE
jgi:hypothetical protein